MLGTFCTYCGVWENKTVINYVRVYWKEFPHIRL